LPRILHNGGSQVSSILIVIRIWARQSLMWFLAEARDYSLLQNVQTGSTDCPVSCQLGVRFLVLKLGMGGAILLLPYMLSWYEQL